MTVKITDELIESHAKALFDRAEAQKRTSHRWKWDEFAEGSATKTFWRGEARFALEAALSALDEGQKAVAWHVYAKNWGDELVFSEKEATAAAERLRTIAGVKEPTVVPLYDRPSSDLREELETLRKALELAAGRMTWASSAEPGTSTKSGRILLRQFADEALAALQSSSQGER